MYYRLVSNKAIKTSIAQPGNQLQFYNILYMSTECLIKLTSLHEKEKKKKRKYKELPSKCNPFC